MKSADRPSGGSIWYFAIFGILVLLPLVLFGAIGAWALWTEGHLLWLTWTLPVCWALAWLVLRRIPRVEIPLPKIGSREHWTPHDQLAGAIVEQEERRLDGITPEQLVDITFYRQRTLDLAEKLARHYHPKAANPLDKLSVVELLTVAQLVTADLEDWFQTYVPASHLITIQQWRLLSHAPGWWTAATNVAWIASVVMNPASLGRYAMSKAFVDPVTKQLQTGLLGALYTFYIRQVGFYLIELNSGRLRGGAAQYRKAMLQLQPSLDAASPPPVQDEPVTVTIAIIGQVKAGKSSLANCLLGNQRAAVDVLPLTRDVNRYELRLEESKDRLILLDTPGYNDSGATREQLDATREAVRQADLVLLVMAATSPAKQADARILEEMNSWFRDQHRLKPPPVIGVVSKIDGLRPVMEWAPPYDWEHPTRPKEQSIRDAVDYCRQSIAQKIPMAPICSDRENSRLFGIEEWLMPLIIVQLDEARAVSLVRSLHQNYDQQRLQKTVSQFVEAGKRIVDTIRKSMTIQS